MSCDESRQRTVQLLYEEHHAWLRGWLRRQTACPADAADLTQDTFVRVLVQKSLASVREPRAYLATVARGLMIDQLRRRQLEAAWHQALAELPEAEYPSPERRAIVLETLVEVDRLLHGLPAKVRAAFLAAQLEGLTYAAIAARLDVSVSSVKQYVARALMHCLMAAESS